jgi:2-dehydro-3-deoxygluconokinase
VSSALLLHLTGITAVISASARDAVGAAIDAAAEADVPVSFDVNHRPSLAGDGSATAIANSPHPLGSSSPGATRVRCWWETAPTKRSFARLAALGPTTVAVKLGAEGALVLHEGVLLRRSAIPIVPRDTVGVGDAFVAGFLAEWLRAEPSRPTPAEPDAIVGIGPRLSMKVGVRSLRAM